jgi:hypothetical protein
MVLPSKPTNDRQAPMFMRRSEVVETTANVPHKKKFWAHRVTVPSQTSIRGVADAAAVRSEEAKQPDGQGNSSTQAAREKQKKPERRPPSARKATTRHSGIFG